MRDDGLYDTLTVVVECEVTNRTDECDRVNDDPKLALCHVFDFVAGETCEVSAFTTSYGVNSTLFSSDELLALGEWTTNITVSKI
jgi:hypothetical protein